MNLLVLALSCAAIALGIILGIGLWSSSGPRPETTALRTTLRSYQLAGPGAVEHEDGGTATTRAKNKLVALADRVVARRGWDDRLSTALSAAAIGLRPGEWVALCGGITLVVALVLFALSGGSSPALFLGLLVGAGAPVGVLKFRKARRRSSFYAALPDALGAFAAALAAGHSPSQAIETTARESSGPMAEEMQRVVLENRLGAQLEDALAGTAARMASEDLSWVVMAIRIQREVGGNLAEVLRGVAATLRQREKQRRQVKALSAEGRLSGVILCALPIGLLVLLSVVNPTYMSTLTGTLLGWLLLGSAGAMLAVGAFWISKVVKVDC